MLSLTKTQEETLALLRSLGHHVEVTCHYRPGGQTLLMKTVFFQKKRCGDRPGYERCAAGPPCPHTYEVAHHVIVEWEDDRFSHGYVNAGTKQLRSIKQLREKIERLRS